MDWKRAIVYLLSCFYKWLRVETIQPRARGKEHIELFILKGKSWLQVFPFQKRQWFIGKWPSNRLQWRKKKAKISRDLIDWKKKKKTVARWSVCIDCAMELSVFLITHAGRAEEMEGVTSLTAHCSIYHFSFSLLCFFDISFCTDI